MKYIVIGASGFVGQNIVRTLETSQREVIGTQSKPRDTRWRTFDVAQDSFNTEFKDILDTQDDELTCILSAAYSQIDQCLLNKDHAFSINVTGLRSVIQDLVHHKIKIVFLSTSFVFDGERGYYKENSPHNPISEYGRQKSIIETHLVNEVPEALVCRLDKIVGDNPSENHLFSDCHKSIKENQIIRCIEGQLFSPTLASDIGHAIQRGVEGNFRGVYNVTNPEYFTRDELLKQFMYAFGESREIQLLSQQDLGFADLRPQKSYLDSSKFIRETGMRFTPMSEVISNYIAAL